MTLTFPFPVKANISDEMSLPSIILTYGDGYKQRRQDGLNLPRTIWNIECPLAKKTDALTLQAFLIDVGNSKPFLWQSPRDTKPEFYYIVGKIGGQYRLGGGSKPDFFCKDDAI
jgi:phage-related protein